jgi:hypothetical protein
MELIWDKLADYRETSLPEGDELYDSQWEEICEAMETIRVEARLPDMITRCKDGDRLMFNDWESWHTGGGCMSYRTDLHNGWYMMLTDTDAGFPCYGETVLVGLYHDIACCEGICHYIEWTDEEKVRLHVAELESQCRLMSKHTVVEARNA